MDVKEFGESVGKENEIDWDESSLNTADASAYLHINHARVLAVNMGYLPSRALITQLLQILARGSQRGTLMESDDSVDRIKQSLLAPLLGLGLWFASLWCRDGAQTSRSIFTAS